MWESFIRHTKTLFKKNYEKIIIARIHARGNDDMDNKARDEMTRKMGKRDKQSNHSYLSTPATPPSLNLCKI
jgi:hypothetical protein